ncbi:MAG TPA: heat-inducible transcriptional repressor HrcA [Dehalococcoidia bacterium]|nr:heat-inducible transcriptional repressor HrcA [Dehalococcoidia bacterium]
MLSERRARLLRLIIDEYITAAQPVGSQALADKYRLALSPATIRNEMALLEDEGYVTHPHTSAGRVPSDKGYRYYVESLMPEEELPEEEQSALRREFRRRAREREDSLRLAAAVLAQLAYNLALVTGPLGPPVRFRYVHLVLLQDLLALMILVLQQAHLRQHLFPLSTAVTQEEMEMAANKLNHLFQGLSAAEIRGRSWEISPLEEQVAYSVLGVMEEEETGGSAEPYVQGLRHVLSQPEFIQNADKVLHILELLDQPDLARTIPLSSIGGERVTVIIGSENRHEAIRDCSLIIGRYGEPGGMRGTLVVLGPTRMRYSRTIAAVRYIAALLSEMASTARL